MKPYICGPRSSPRRDASGPNQVDLRKLDLARAMIAKPRLLFVDEAMAGLSHSGGRRDPRCFDAHQRQCRRHRDDRAHHARGYGFFAEARSFWSQGARLPTAIPSRSSPKLRFRRPTLENSLAISGLSAGYGRVLALHDVSLTVEAGETVALLGTNGNGKSSLMKCVMGLLRPSSGSVVARIGEDTIDLSGTCDRGDCCARGDPRPGRAAPSAEAHRRGESRPRRVASPGAPSHPSQPSGQL